MDTSFVRVTPCRPAAVRATLSNVAIATAGEIPLGSILCLVPSQLRSQEVPFVRIGEFATAITCIDGRMHVPVAEWLKKYHSVKFVDVETIPAPEKALTS